MSAEHDCITVGNRRWCLNCTLYQTRRNVLAAWLPGKRSECPMTTPRAREILKEGAAA